MHYLDNNATTQVAPQVLEAMMPFLNDSFGNPSSIYGPGRAVRGTIDQARENVADLLGAAEADEIVFTSCGTESDNWAVLGALEAAPANRHIITTQVEHEAIRKLADKLERNAVRVTRLSVDPDGAIDLGELQAELSPDTAIVSVMHANNETGIIFPVEEIAATVKEHSRALMHVDGVNAVGKIPIDLKNTSIDLYSISAHKFHGPKGIGALYISRGIELPPMLTGGGQENNRRPGTEAVHQIAGIGAAAKFVSDLSEMERVRALRDELEKRILGNIPVARLNGTADPLKRLPNTSSISFENVNGEAILSRLDDLGICVSTGSACASSDHSISPVLQAMNIPYARAAGTVRFSLGRFNNQADIEAVFANLPRIITDLRRLAAD
jgi:cysteine desulfurase